MHSLTIFEDNKEASSEISIPINEARSNILQNTKPSPIHEFKDKANWHSKFPEIQGITCHAVQETITETTRTNTCGAVEEKGAPPKKARIDSNLDEWFCRHKRESVYRIPKTANTRSL